MALTEYTVSLHHPEGVTPFVFNLSSFDEAGAIARCRMAAMHHTGEVEYLTCPADCVTTADYEAGVR
jgi:hypothetical protein